MNKLLKFGLLFVLIGIVAVVAIPLTTDNQIFSFDSDENYTLTEKSYTYNQFNAFDFDFDNRNVFVYESEDDQIHIRYYVHEKDTLSYKDDTNELTISISRRWVDHFFIFDIGSNKDYFDVYLYLPANITSSSLFIQTSNGEIEIDTDLEFQTLNLRSSNGDIDLLNTQAISLKAVTSNGDIDLNNVDVSQSISGKTSNGKVNLDQVTAAEIDFHTSNGKINAQNITSPKVKLKTSNGEIYVSINGEMDDYKIDLSTSLGDKIVNDLKISSGLINPEKTNSVQLESSLGDVEVQFLND
ncbi:MAG: DUF4097 family beta strand repeat-containing protein [Candidatus Izemoplasmatales bacterium]